MKQLFEIDLRDYEKDYEVFKRPSARAVILKDNLIGLVYSKRENIINFPVGELYMSRTRRMP